MNPIMRPEKAKEVSWVLTNKCCFSLVVYTVNPGFVLMKATLLCLLPFTLVFVFSGCGGSKPTSHYPVGHTGLPHKLEKGTIASARDVIIDGQATMLGTSVGAAVGSAAGVSSVGSIRTDSDVRQAVGTAAVGGIVGAAAGRAVEKILTEKRGQELVIQLEGGERVIVIQPMTNRPFEELESVLVYTTMKGGSRIYHEDEDPFLDSETKAYIVDEDFEGEEFEPATW